MRATVRAAIAAYLQAATLPSVGTVFTARPEVIDESDYENSIAGAVSQFVGSAGGSSAVLIVNIPDGKRTRKAMTGRTSVSDVYVHQVVLEVILANTTGDAGAAQDDHDTLVDALVVALRSDPLLGSPSIVWSAGEFSAGIQAQQSMPFTGADGLTVFIVGVVRLEVWEQLEGSGV